MTKAKPWKKPNEDVLFIRGIPIEEKEWYRDWCKEVNSSQTEVFVRFVIQLRQDERLREKILRMPPAPRHKE